jgi:hypothetical protein
MNADTDADREALPYPPDYISADDIEPNLPWWLVFDQAEGFQPWTMAVQAEWAEDAEDIYMAHPRNTNVDDESIAIMPIRCVLPAITDLHLTWQYDGRRPGPFNQFPGGPVGSMSVGTDRPVSPTG